MTLSRFLHSVGTAQMLGWQSAACIRSVLYLEYHHLWGHSHHGGRDQGYRGVGSDPADKYYMDRKGRSDPVYCPQGEKRRHAYGYTVGLLSCVMTVQSSRCARCEMTQKQNQSLCLSDPAYCAQVEVTPLTAHRGQGMEWDLERLGTRHCETQPTKPLT